MGKTTNEDNKLLFPLLTEPAELRREARKRKSPFETKSVKKAEVQEHIDQGWEIDKHQKVKVRIKRPRTVDERIENRVWFLLYQLGYAELNEGRHFKIKIKRKNAGPLNKQVDVYAKDDETVIIAECKANKKLTRRSLQKDIEEFANLKGPMASSVKKHYGPEYKPKIVWLFVTENIIWSNPDKERAIGENIQIITERELRYYAQIADHLGPAARYQFLAQFLQNQKIPELSDVKTPAIRGVLGGHKYYCFVSTPKQLLKLSFINHRSLNHPDGAPTYQRLVSRTRLKQIGRFLMGGGFFPTNFLISFNKPVRFDPIKKNPGGNITFGELHLPDRYRSAWIIDGQHRLYGYAPLGPKYLDHNIVVIAFDNLKKEQEANLFVTINHEQKSVSKTLLDDLEGELKWGSDIPSERIGAIAARLINVLNADIGEPFHNKVTQQGITATDNTCLTVPALKDALRRSGLLGSTVLNKQVYDPGPFSGVSDSMTLDRARAAINHFFSMIRDSNLRQWEKGRKGFLLTNVAIQGYLLLLASLIKYMEVNKGLDAKELEPQEAILEVEEYCDPILKYLEQASDNKIEKDFKVQFGSGGPKEYYFRLCNLVKNQFSDFTPEGMDSWETEQSGEKIENADKKIKELGIKVQSYIFEVFKNKYGTNNQAYWEKGVVDKSIKTRAYEKSQDDDIEKRLPLEHYLDFIDYKKIVENKEHWPLLKAVFNIPEPGEKGLSKNLKWMININALRRIPAHPTEKRHYKAEDFNYLDFVYEEFMKNLESAKPRQESQEPISNDSV